MCFMISISKALIMFVNTYLSLKTDFRVLKAWILG